MAAAKKKAAGKQGRLGPRWKSRVIGRAEVDPRKLKDNPLNWRLHPSTQQRVMQDAMERIGVIDDIIVNKRTGHIIDGHGRKDLAIANEEPTVGVLYVDLSPDEERQALAIINPMAELAAVDPEKLGALLGEVKRGDGPVDQLLAELEQLAVGAIVKETKGEGSGGTRALGGSTNVLRMMLENPDVATVERALSMTGLMNRGDAFLAICKQYLGSTSNAEGQHDTKPQGGLEDQLAAALGVDSGDSGNARRPRKSVRARVPRRKAGSGVRDRPGESGDLVPPATELERVPGEGGASA